MQSKETILPEFYPQSYSLFTTDQTQNQPNKTYFDVVQKRLFRSTIDLTRQNKL